MGKPNANLFFAIPKRDVHKGPNLHWGVHTISQQKKEAAIRFPSYPVFSFPGAVKKVRLVVCSLASFPGAIKKVRLVACSLAYSFSSFRVAEEPLDAAGCFFAPLCMSSGVRRRKRLPPK